MYKNTSKKLILSIDGGGIKGIIATRLLSHLEKELKQTLQETFQIYSGTSTGALIISSIAHLGLTAEYITNDLYSQEKSQKI